MSKGFIIGFQSSRYNNRTLSDELEFTLNNEINCFDLFFDGFLPHDLKKEEIDKIIKLKETGFVFTFHFPIADYSEKGEFIDELINFSNLILPSTLTIHFDRLKEEILAYIVKRLNNSIKVSIENTTQRYNIYHNLDYLNLMRELNKRYSIYSTFDIGHCFINRENVIEQIDLLKKNNIMISTLHIHSNDGEKDMHLSIDKGIIDYPEIIKHIINNKLNPIFIIEHWEDNIKTYQILKELLAG